MDLYLFGEMLSIDSTSGRERKLSDFLLSRLEAEKKEVFDVGDGTQNLLLSWGRPRVVFCTHMDTVPPYIAPHFEETEVKGRGTCDAKGQIFAMYTACRALADEGFDGFGLLFLSGEETGSWGAKSFSKTPFTAPYLVIGEPTDNCMVSATKGTKSFELTFTGKAFHSGYPEKGRSAVDMFVDFINELRAAGFPEDPVLGPTTWNVGKLSSDNPQNILSPEARCRIYFRTTFESDAAVSEWMLRKREGITVKALGGDVPAKYMTLEGFKSKCAAFGSDAPHLGNFSNKIICGPGSIEVAHRDDESVCIHDLSDAVENYVAIYHALK